MYWSIQHLWAPHTKVRTDFFLLRWMNMKQTNCMSLTWTVTDCLARFALWHKRPGSGGELSGQQMEFALWLLGFPPSLGQGTAVSDFLWKLPPKEGPASVPAVRECCCLLCRMMGSIHLLPGLLSGDPSVYGFLRTYVGVTDIHTTAAFLPGWILPSRSLDNIVTLTFVGFDSTLTCRQHRVVAARIHILIPDYSRHIIKGDMLKLGYRDGIYSGRTDCSPQIQGPDNPGQ